MLGRLPRRFFERPPEQVAPDLLGCEVVRTESQGVRRGRIVEVEAYRGQDDPAAHAYRGPTPRTRVLFGAAGHAYIYRSYGLHWCLNVSTERPGRAGCVLLRALELEPGIAESGRAASGPGRLTRALAITGALNGVDLTAPGPLQIVNGALPRGRIAVTARIGIRRAVEQPLRFYLTDSPAVSSPRGPVLHWIEPRKMGTEK